MSTWRQKALIDLPMRHEQFLPDEGWRTNLVRDGNMAMSGTTAWTAGNSATLTKQAAGFGQVLRVAYSETSNPYAYQAILPTVGGIYRVTGWARGDGSYAPAIDQVSTNRWSGTSSTDWQEFDFVFTSVTSGEFRLVSVGSGAGYTEWDIVSFEELIIEDEDMEDAGTSAWTSYNGALLTKETGSPPEIGGVQILKIRTTIGSPGGADQSGVLTVSDEYEIEGWARGDGTVYPTVGDSGASARYWKGTSSTSWQHFKVAFTASQTDIRLARIGAGTDNYVEFGGVILRAVSPRVRNLGKAGALQDAVLGDGSTSTTFPSKLYKGAGFEFDGGDYLSMKDDYVLNSGKLTVAMTVKLAHGFKAEALPAIFAWEDTGTTTVAVIIGVSASDVLRIYVGGTVAANAASFPFDQFNEGQIITIVGVYDGTDTKLYVNGVQGTDAGTPVAPASTYEAVRIGVRESGSPYLTAGSRVYDCAVLDFALTESQIRQYHQEQMAMGYR